MAERQLRMEEGEGEEKSPFMILILYQDVSPSSIIPGQSPGIRRQMLTHDHGLRPLPSSRMSGTAFYIGV
jgi:hypothetical protein